MGKVSIDIRTGFQPDNNNNKERSPKVAESGRGSVIQPKCQNISVVANCNELDGQKLQFNEQTKMWQTQISLTMMEDKAGNLKVRQKDGSEIDLSIRLIKHDAHGNKLPPDDVEHSVPLKVSMGPWIVVTIHLGVKPVELLPRGFQHHFQWLPDIAEVEDAKDLIKKFTSKRSSEPWLETAYLVTLARLHTHPAVADLPKSLELLKKAEELQKKQTEASSSFVDAEYLIKVAKLKMRVHQDCDGLPPDWEADVRALDELWEQPKLQAAVRGALGWIQLRLGFAKLDSVEPLFEEAKRKDPENALWLFGLVLVRSRVDRSRSFRSPVGEDAIGQWKEVENKMNSSTPQNELMQPLFLVSFAKALLNMPGDGKTVLDKCFERIKKAFEIVKKDPSRYVYELTLCISVCRKLKMKELEEWIKFVNDKIASFDSRCYDLPKLNEQIARWHLARERRAREKPKLSRQFFEKAGPEWNFWVARELIGLDWSESNDRQKGSTEEQEYIHRICLRYDSLQLRQSMRSAHRNAILAEKGYFLAIHGRCAEGAKCIVRALSEYAQDEVPKFSECLNPYKIKTLKELKDEDGICKFLRTFVLNADKENSERIKDDAAAVQSYREIIKDNPNQLATEQLATEQLGVLLLKSGNFDEAKTMFKSLDASLAHRRALIADSILLKLEGETLWQALSLRDKRDALEECLRLECKHAAELVCKFLQEVKNGTTRTKFLESLAAPAERAAAAPAEQAAAAPAERAAAAPAKQAAAAPAEAPQPLLHQQAQYELVARLLNLRTSSSAFFIKRRMQHDDDGSGKRFHEHYRKAEQKAEEKFRDRCTEAKRLLDLDEYPRRTLLKATRHHLRSERQEEELMLKLTLENSHKALDHAWYERNRRVGEGVKTVRNFPFAYKKKEIITDFSKKELKDQVIAFNLSSPVGLKRESVEDTFAKHFPNQKDKCFFPAVYVNTDEEAKFLVDREHRNLSQEGAWIILWVSYWNEEKHEKQQDKFSELEQRVKGWLKAAGAPKSVYELAHRAAEYAEEVRLVLRLCASGSKEASDSVIRRSAEAE